MSKSKIQVYDYKINSTLKEEFVEPKDISKFTLDKTVSWINITASRDREFISEIGTKLELDPLTIEDILNESHRTKLEVFDNYAYFVLKGVERDDTSHSLTTFQISIILTKSYVVTFLHDEHDVFDNIVKRLQKNPKGRLRTNGTEFLAYALLDEVVDTYLESFSVFDDKIDELDQIINGQQFSKETPNTIYQLKREVSSLRKMIAPLRESALSSIKSDLIFTDEHLQKYLRDLIDHITSAIEMLDNHKENLGELLDLYHTYMNNRMNEIMKVLTIMSSIFIPLSFLVGLYGMNFVYIPELSWQYGYFYVLGLGSFIVIAMLTFFKVKNGFNSN